VTGFLRSNRGIDSEVDDTFTIILQYAGAQKNLLVTIKTGIVSHMKDQLKYLVRGTGGTYLKVSDPNGLIDTEADVFAQIKHILASVTVVLLLLNKGECVENFEMVPWTESSNDGPWRTIVWYLPARSEGDRGARKGRDGPRLRPGRRTDLGHPHHDGRV
jgi:hypothetical protein